MSSARDSPSSLPPTPKQASGPESTARDTVPTGPLPHSTIPPRDVDRNTSSVPKDHSIPRPTSEVRSVDGESEQATLHSASHPGSSLLPQWDERRVLHLEHEFDQLSARIRLLDKRIDELVLRFRALVALAVLFALLLAALLIARS